MVGGLTLGRGEWWKGWVGDLKGGGGRGGWAIWQKGRRDVVVLEFWGGRKDWLNLFCSKFQTSNSTDCTINY